MRLKGISTMFVTQGTEAGIELSAEDLARQLTKHDIDMLHLYKIEEKVIKAIKNELIPQEME